MKLFVLSDSHRNLAGIDRIIDRIKECDSCIHLGDNTSDADYIGNRIGLPVYSVKGNCDTGLDALPEIIVRAGGRKIFCTHGHLHGVKYSMDRLRYAALENEADIVLFGHTHAPQMFYSDMKLFLNPGSMHTNRDVAGSASYAVIEVNGDEIRPQIIYI